jgi:hypothetical protein
MPPFLEGDRLFEGSMGTLQRLHLPIGSPPRLSMFLSIGIILLLGLILYNIRTKQNRKILLAYVASALVLTVMLFLTMSRSGLIALAGGSILLIYLWKSDLFYRYVFLKVSLGLYVVTILIIVAIILPGPVHHAVERMSSTIGGLTEHLQTRLEALAIWSASLKNILVGVGLSNYQLYAKGVHSHSAYTTVIAERGLIGSFTYWPFYFYPFLVLFLSATAHSHEYKWQAYKRALAAILFVIIFGSLFYEFMQERNIWVVMGLAGAALGLSSSTSKSKKLHNIRNRHQSDQNERADEVS